MQINGPKSLDVQQTNLAPSADELDKKLRGKKAGVQSGGTETVHLSSRARDINKVRDTLKTVPDVRTDVVARLKDSIAQGTYQVSGEKVAEKMITEHLADLMA
ncbi:MAG: flagellar biosynthesis anti-sigma factor FlgM [Deltaproteobacteria bacterium]|nr:flagellar biosynthesis anti-sigma factor FlgM [Deltaproteobacteria bacterium]